VIDVNTGRFTGGKGLEDTITRNNLEAAREVVRQLRLRDIGGIIIIDFIDMEYARNREAVLAKLQAELETDRTKTYVVEISPLGLVEMTRQNITDGARGILTQTCPFCEGKARILSAETMAISVERRLGDQPPSRRPRRCWSRSTPRWRSGSWPAGASSASRRTPQALLPRGLEASADRDLPHSRRGLARGGRVAPHPGPRGPGGDRRAGVRPDLQPGDAVAHVDGFQLIVLNGRRALGDKRKVRITSLTRAGPWGCCCRSGALTALSLSSSIEGRCLTGEGMTDSTTPYAIVRCGGKQYKVAKGDSIVVDRVGADEGAHIDMVPLAVRDESGEMRAARLRTPRSGPPWPSICSATRSTCFTYKPKSTFKKSRGHRSRLTRLDIDAIEIAGQKEKKSGS